MCVKMKFHSNAFCILRIVGKQILHCWKSRLEIPLSDLMISWIRSLVVSSSSASISRSASSASFLFRAMPRMVASLCASLAEKICV